MKYKKYIIEQMGLSWFFLWSNYVMRRQGWGREESEEEGREGAGSNESLIVRVMEGMLTESNEKRLGKNLNVMKI